MNVVGHVVVDKWPARNMKISLRLTDSSLRPARSPTTLAGAGVLLDELPFDPAVDPGLGGDDRIHRVGYVEVGEEP